MTLVAAWKENNVPFLIGDLVVSTLGYSEKPHGHLPTRNDLDTLIPKMWERRVVKTCQKVYKISDSFVIGWCDTLVPARHIIQDIMRKFQDTAPSLEAIKSYLRSQAGFESHPCTLIGWLVESGVSHCFRWSSDKTEDFELKESFVDGSGKEYFEDICQPDVIAGSENPVNHAIGKIANLLGHEVLYGTNLWNLFGGGFQVIYLKNKSFEVLPSVTFVFFYAKEDVNRIDFIQHRRVLNFQYESDYLRTSAMIDSSSQQLAEREIYYTSPIHKNSDAFDGPKKEITLEADYYCFYIDLFLKEGIRAAWVYTIEDREKEGILKIQKSANNLHSLVLGEELFKKVALFLHDLDRNNMPR